MKLNYTINILIECFKELNIEQFEYNLKNLYESFISIDHLKSDLLKIMIKILNQ